MGHSEINNFLFKSLELIKNLCVHWISLVVVYHYLFYIAPIFFTACTKKFDISIILHFFTLTGMHKIMPGIFT